MRQDQHAGERRPAYPYLQATAVASRVTGAEAHVLRPAVVEDETMVGALVHRLFDKGVRVLVLQEGSGEIAGFGPFIVERLELSPGYGPTARPEN